MDKISIRGDLLAVFVTHPHADREETRYVCVFKLGIERPVRVLQQEPTPSSQEEDLIQHQWSPQSKHLAVCWNHHKADCYVAFLSLSLEQVQRKASHVL